MQVNPQELVKQARTWLNTPWRHQRAEKHRGVDCINFLWQVAYDSGLVLPQIPERYSRMAMKDEIKIYLDKNLTPVQKTDIQTGRVLLFHFAGFNTHVGIATSNSRFIHASQAHKKVVEHELDSIWLRTHKGTWEV